MNAATLELPTDLIIYHQTQAPIMPLSYKASYYPWITQHVDAAIIRENIQQLLQITEEKLTVLTGEKATIDLMPVMEVPEQIDSIVKGDCQIALMNPLGFVFAAEKEQNVKVVSIVERFIKGQWGLSYFAQLYTHKITAFQPLTPDNTVAFKNQLKKKSIGFGSAISTSNFLIPAYELYKLGLHPLNAFTRTDFFGGHDTVAQAVYERRVDIGCGHDGVIIDLATKYGYGDANEKLVTLLQSEKITSDPIAVNLADGTQYTNLQKALEIASKTPEGLKAIQTFWGKGRYLLPPGVNDNYNNLKDAMKAMGIKASHVLG